MHLATLGAFVVLEIVLCLIPGPAVMSVVSAALSRRQAAGYATASGILTGNTIYFVVSALGLASVLVASHRAFLVLKWCGAVYLGYLGIRALAARPTDLEPLALMPSDAIARGWLNGTIVQLSNPKALVFFAAILPQFINPAGNVPLQIAILGVAGLLVEFAILSMYITGVDRIRERGFSTRSGIWAQRLGGALLIGVAVAVVREST
jgi:homoserine/homoserine lactone efflux protein